MKVQRILSACTIGAVGLACKAFLLSGFKNVTVTGINHILDALDDVERKKGRGVVTVSNHISTLDDPLTWGVLPFRCFTNLRDMRWTLGASDIIFTNPVFSEFFRQGQVLETFRGKGVYQHSVDMAIKKLNEGLWVHLFGEGKVNQPYQYQLLQASSNHDSFNATNLVAKLPRFKWGVGRILTDTERLPAIIPMWLSGFENVMPEPRPTGFPAKFLPQLQQSVTISFGKKIDETELKGVLTAVTKRRDPLPVSSSLISRAQNMGNLTSTDLLARQMQWEAVTALVHKSVEDLGYSASGPLLGVSSSQNLSPKPYTSR